MAAEITERDAGARRVRPGPLRAALWMAAGALLVVTALAAGTLLALPMLEQRPELLAGWLSDQVGRSVRVREVEFAWRDGAPALRLRGLEVAGTGRDTGTLEVGTAEVRLDALGSLRTRTLRPRSVTVHGSQLTLIRSDDGELAIAGFGLDRAARTDQVAGLAVASLPPGAVLGIEKARLTLRGFDIGAAGSEVVLEPVSLNLRAAGDGVRLSGAIATATSPDTPLRFTVRWDDASRSPLQGADVTFSARGVPLQALPGTPLSGALTGKLDLDLDGTLDGGSRLGLRGTLAIAQPELSTDAGTLALEALQSLVELSASADDWLLTLLRLQARENGKLLPASTLSLSGRADAGAYLLRVDHAPVAALRALLPFTALPPALSAQLASWVHGTGWAEDVRMTLASGRSGPRPQQLQAQLRELALGGVDMPLSVAPTDMSISIQGDAGRVVLNDSAARITVHTAATPIDMTAGGSIRWHVNANALQLDSEDLVIKQGETRIELAGAAVVPLNGTADTHLALRARSENLDATTLKQNLALGLLPADLSDWLQEAFLDGRASAATVEVDASLAELAKLGGVVRVDARVEELSMRYQPGWPTLDAVSGRLRLDGTRFTFEITEGRTAGARIVAANGIVDDVTAPHVALAIKGNLRGLTEHGAAFFMATPMRASFADVLQQLDARGPAALELELRIPLTADSGNTRVRATLELDENSMRLPALRSHLEKVNGRMDFDEKGLRGGTLKAAYLDRTISVRIDGLAGERQRTSLTIDGATDPRGLARQLYDVGAVDSQDPAALPLLSQLSGEAPWQVALDIPHRDPLSGEGIGLVITSGLEDMALALPAPLGKTAGQRRTLAIRTRLTAEGPRVFRVQFGESTSAVLEMARGASGFELRRGELLFGAKAELPDERGLRVAGNVKLLPVDDWLALFSQLAAPGPRSATFEPPLGLVRAVDLNAARLVTLGAGFDQVRLQAERPDSKRWQVKLDGDGVKGEILIPDQMQGGTIEARFERLYVSRNGATSVRDRDIPIDFDPKLLPDVHVVAQKLRYADVELGLAKLALRASADGLEIRELFALNDAFELRGSGRWIEEGASVRSRLDLRMHSNDLGKLTRALGYGDSDVEGGVSSIALSAHWLGSPFDFGLDRVEGELHFRATGGRLRGLEPGTMGRVFGLLSLDFKDLFDKGMGYELIEGSFRLGDGDARTENISIHTPTARLDLKGRIGLVAQDYDQILTVTPKLSASLPLAPLWLAEQLLDRKLIDPAFAYRYIISGTWDDPKVEREQLKAEPRELL